MNTINNKMAMILASMSTAAVMSMPLVANESTSLNLEPSSKYSSKNSLGQAENEVVFVPVYDPRAERVVLKRCEDYPECDDHIDYQLSGNDSDNN